MAKSLLYRISRLLIVMGVVLGLFQPIGVEAYKKSGFVDPKHTSNKIEPLVLHEIETQVTTDFFVWMTEKADLSQADHMKTKLEKGKFVFNVLTETAERTQKDLRAFLDDMEIDYQAFYISNKILVRGGSRNLLIMLAARADVAEITANHKFQLDRPVDPRPAYDSENAIEPNLIFINADDVWAMGYDGNGTVMAGNDTGIDETHLAIAPHYRGCLNPPDCTNWDHNYNWWDATGTYPINPQDGYGHGTMVTGVMIGDDNNGNQIGVAPGAKTIHCKNMTDGGSGDDSTFTECFQWDLAPWDLSGVNPNPALAPDAVNNSWGYWSGGQPLFKDEIQALHAAGILVEASTGGDGPGCMTIRSPADYWEVLTTGMINNLDPFPGTLTGNSARGPSEIDGNYFPDIMAPGQNIRSAVPGNSYESWSGTSMSGPHATALVGLLWNACPSLRGLVYPTIDYIHQAAVPLTGQNGSNCGGDYTNGPNNDWGEGTIDALATVQLVLESCTLPAEANWEKEIWVNAEGPFDTTEPFFSVATGDEVIIVDHVFITSTTAVSFTLEEAWQTALALIDWQTNDGTVITDTDVLTWEVTSGLTETWYTITKTFEVLGGDWISGTLSENLSVDGVLTQPAPVDLTFNHLLPDIMGLDPVESTLFQGALLTVELNIANEGDDDLVWQIAIEPTATWLTLDSISGTTLPGEVNLVILTLDSTYLEPGIYTTTLNIISNDPDEALIYVPVFLTVQAPPIEILTITLPLIIKH